MTGFDKITSQFDGLTFLEGLFVLIVMVAFVAFIRWTINGLIAMLSKWFGNTTTNRPPTPPTLSEIYGVEIKKNTDWYVSPNGEVRNKLIEE